MSACRPLPARSTPVTGAADVLPGRGVPRLPALVIALVGLLVAALPATASPGNAPSLPWATSWATAQHATGPELKNQTVRTVLRLSQGGTSLRVRLGHQNGTTPLVVDAVSVALSAGGSRLQPASLRTLTFSGRRSATIRPGRVLFSDPVRLDTRSGQDLAVSVSVRGAVVPSAHTSAFRTGYLTAAGAGDRTGEASGHSYTGTTTSFLIVDAVDVRSAGLAGTIVVVGGSVVDGLGSEKTGPLGTGPAAPVDSRWSDVLAARLAQQPAGRRYAVANAGISANTAARTCALTAGPDGNVQDRFDRHVLGLSGVRYVLIYAGTNDVGIGTGCTSAQILAAYDDLIRRARAAGAKVVVSTITPRASYTPAQNADRARVNAVIRDRQTCSGRCDGIVDFDAVLRWSTSPNAVDPALDSGDTLHPNADGYRAMGRSVDLQLFARR